ncbi:MAG: hypothetical protein AAF430_18325 [Myxococcota bacterium]
MNWRIFVIGLLFFACVDSSEGPRVDGKHSSAMGFAIAVPESWLILDGKQVSENPDLFAGAFAGDDLQAVDQNVLSAVRAQIEAGAVEFYYPDYDDGFGFRDNVSVQKSASRVPQNESQLAEICLHLSTELGKMFGRPVEVSACELRPLADAQALYIQADGAVPSTKMMQYHIQKSRSVTLIVTGTSSMASLDRLDRELGELVQSIEF